MPLILRGFFLVLLASIACHGEEGRLRKQVAGKYVRETRYTPPPPHSADPSVRFSARQVPAQVSRRYELMLHEDGWWTGAYISEPPNRRWDTRDSGTYRIVNNRVIVRAVTTTEDGLRMFWIGRDTLHEMEFPTDTTGAAARGGPPETGPWIGTGSNDALKPGIYVVRVK